MFIVVLLGGALLLTAMTLGDALIAAQRFKSRLLAVTAGLALNAMLCRLWVENYDLIGVAWAGALSAAAACIVCVLALRLSR